MLKKLISRAEFFQERDVYVGLCPELNVSSFGDDVEDPKSSLQEAIEVRRMGSWFWFIIYPNATGQVLFVINSGPY